MQYQQTNVFHEKYTLREGGQTYYILFQHHDVSHSVALKRTNFVHKSAKTIQTHS